MCFFCRGCLHSTSLATQYWLAIRDSQPLEWNRIAVASPLPHVWLGLFLEQNFFSYDFFVGVVSPYGFLPWLLPKQDPWNLLENTYMYRIMISLLTWVDRLISKQLWLSAFDDVWSLGWGFGCSDWCRGFSDLRLTTAWGLLWPEAYGSSACAEAFLCSNRAE